MPHHNHKLPKVIALITVIIAFAALVLPWKQWMTNELVKQFEAQGFENVQLAVASVGVRGIEIEQLSIGKESPLTLSHLTLHYTLSELWYGGIGGINLQGLNLLAQQRSGKWSLSGIAASTDKSSAETTFLLPVTQSDIDDIPLNAATLKDSHLRFATDSWNMDIPLHVIWQKSPTATLAYKAEGLQFNWQDVTIKTGDTTLDAALRVSEKQWSGLWHSKDITIEGFATPIPPLTGEGKLSANGSKVMISGIFNTADKQYMAAFRLDYNMNPKEPSVLILDSITMPWSNGSLSLHDVKIALGSKNPLRLNLEVDNISVDALLQMLTGKRATGTGTVSGTIPISIAANGSITFLKGGLQAKEAGTITMAPDAIPGDNQQITLVRDILKNLHYKVLSVSLNSSAGNKQAIILSVEGNNPDVYDGRPVKLNVQLNGDVLNLIQQSVMPFTNPKQLLK